MTFPGSLLIGQVNLKRYSSSVENLLVPDFRTKRFLNPTNRINFSQELTQEKIFLLAEGLLFWASVLRGFYLRIRVVQTSVNEGLFRRLLLQTTALKLLTLIIFNVLFIRYEPFDFHKECSKMRWERLSILTDKLKANQDKFG